MSIKKKFAALVAACAIVLALPAMAFAANPTFDPTTVNVGADETTIVKVNHPFPAANGKVYVKISYVDAEQVGNFDTAAPEGVPTGSIEVPITKDSSPYEYTLDRQALFNGVTFSAPGTYKFLVQQDTTTDHNNDVKYDTNAAGFYVRVQVTVDPTNPEKLKVSGYTSTLTTTTEGKTSGADALVTFTNTANAGGNFTLSKVITGNAFNKATDINDTFDFTVTVANAGDTAYTYEIANGAAEPVTKATCTVDTSGKTLKFTNNGGGSFTIKLKHGSSLVIKGLPEDATVKAVETQPADTYTDVKVSTNAGDEASVKESGYSGTVTITSSATSLKFNNVKSVGDNPATGLIMEFGPYVLIALAAIAAAVVFVIARRRRRESDEF